MKTVKILDINFAKIDLQKTVRKIRGWVEKGGRYQLMTLNPEYLVRIQEDESLRRVVEKADLVVADGTGIILASWLIYLKNRLYGRKTERLTLKERITGGELVEALAKLAAKEGWKVGLIGGEEGVAEKALLALKRLVKQHKENNHLTIQPFNHSLRAFADRGPENVRRQTKEEFRRVKQLLLKGRPQILLTSFSFYGPIWIEKILKALQSRGKSLVAIEVGGVFNYLADASPRPPKLIRQIGLEWLWRLITEPWRIRRQLSLIKFVWAVLTTLPSPGSPKAT